MLSPVQCPFALPGLLNLRTSDGYFILMAVRFAAKACFFWFAALALICFCAACLCTAFGDLSPIFLFCLSAAGITDPQHVDFSESYWNREFQRGCCQFANGGTNVQSLRSISQNCHQR